MSKFREGNIIKKFPIVAFYQNIIFNSNGKAFALYRLDPMPYNFFSLERKGIAVSTMEEILGSFHGQGQIFLLWDEIEMNENSYLHTNMGSSEGIFRSEIINHTKSVKEAISAGARIMRRYISMELPLNAALSTVDEFFQYSRDTVLKAMMTMRPLLPNSIKERAIAEEKELFGRLMKYSLTRASFHDLDFIIRKSSQRMGVLPPPLPDKRETIFTPAAIAAFTDGNTIDEAVNYVTITDNVNNSHLQSFIHFVDYPENISKYGINLFQTGEFAFPFDTVIHFNILSPHIALQQTESKRRLLLGQAKEALRSGEDMGISDEKGLGVSRQLAAKLEAGKSLASISICMAVAHTDRRELSARIAQLQSNFTAKHFRVVRPSSKQLESLISFLPGSAPSAPMVQCDPGFIAALGPTFAFEVGDPRGFFLGWSGHTPVYWEPGRAARELNKTNAILISGSLGGGKSVLSKSLANFTLMNGGYVLAIDPKEEYWPFKLLYKDHVNIVDLSPRGGIALNPFLFSDVEITAQSIAQNFLIIALNATGKEGRLLAISQALERLYQMPRPERHMHNFIRCLNDVTRENPNSSIKEEAQQSAFLLESMQRTDIGRMVFGKENVKFFGDKERMVVINIKEIPRPTANTDPSRYTESERQGLALIYLISAIARETAFGLPRNAVKMLIFDEAWVMASISEGERLLDELIRIGRSYNLIPVLISQNITDLEKPVFINNSSQVFCFRALSAEETKAGLRILGADEEAVPPETFAKLQPGVCLFRDNENRVGWLQVEVKPDYLITDIFNSKPDAQLEELRATLQ